MGVRSADSVHVVLNRSTAAAQQPSSTSTSSSGCEQEMEGMRSNIPQQSALESARHQTEVPAFEMARALLQKDALKDAPSTYSYGKQVRRYSPISAMYRAGHRVHKYSRSISCSCLPSGQPPPHPVSVISATSQSILVSNHPNRQCDLSRPSSYASDAALGCGTPTQQPRASSARPGPQKDWPRLSPK